MTLFQTIGKSPQIVDEMLAGLNHALILAEPDGTVVFAARAVENVLGYRQEELQGGLLSAIFTPEDLSYLYPNLLFLSGRGSSFEGEVMLRRKNGANFFAYLTVHPCSSNGDGHYFVACGVHDIDKQKMLERSLRETHYEDLVKVANSIAHELRNPLVGIGGFVTRLYNSSPMGLEQDKYYQFIIKNLQRIESLVKNIEFLITLPKPYFTPEKVGDLVERAAEPYLERMSGGNVEFVNDVEDDTVMVDRELLALVFSIMIENSIEAMPKGGRLGFSGGINGDYCRITVSDTGVGIAPEDMPHIFSPFFSTKADGEGIDLAVLKRIVESHLGRLEVESRPGEGTTFILWFPLERRRRIRTALLQD